MTVYLLAAGRGRRAGGPKAWADCGGRPLLERQLDFIRSLGAEAVVSVQEQWLPKLGDGATWVPVDPDAPAMASLKALLRARPGGGLVWHVDMRVWEPGLIGALSGTSVPVYQGRRGHPVSLSADDAAQVAALPESGRLDHFLRDRAKEVQVPFACALDNWNDGR